MEQGPTANFSSLVPQQIALRRSFAATATYASPIDLAGVRPQDIHISLQGNQLRLSGSRRDWCLEKGCRQIRMEISYTRFERTIELPAALRGARLLAEHRHGLLLVRLETEGADNE